MNKIAFQKNKVQRWDLTSLQARMIKYRLVIPVCLEIFMDVHITKEANKILESLTETEHIEEWFKISRRSKLDDCNSYLISLIDNWPHGSNHNINILNSPFNREKTFTICRKKVDVLISIIQQIRIYRL